MEWVMLWMSVMMQAPAWKDGAKWRLVELQLAHVCDSFWAVYHRTMNGTTPDVTAFILAGGKSTRMGTDKAFAALDGRTLLARALDLARSVAPDVRVVGDAAKFAAFAPVVEDVFRDCGPLGGIHAALRA